MKTITMSDEVYEFLKSCQEELKTQDNRGTANPIFGFREIMECPIADGYADDGIVFEPLWEQYKHIIKDRGAIVLFGSEPLVYRKTKYNSE